MGLHISSGVVYGFIAGTADRRSCAIPQGVTEIADYAFFNEQNLKEIVLPNSVQRIGERAFYHCVSLERIILPRALKSIDPAAFSRCGSLQRVERAPHLERIGMSAFEGCSHLREISLPQSLRVIAPRAFAECMRLKNIALPPTVTVCDDAFYKCACREIFIPSSARIQSNAFCSMPNLERITFGGENILPSTAKDCSSPPHPIFQACRKLKEIFVAKEVRSYCVRNGLLLNGDGTELLRVPPSLGDRIVIPEGVQRIRRYAFEGCCHVKEIILPTTLQEIIDGAFAETSVERMLIPDGVRSLGNIVFLNCAALKRVHFPADVKEVGAGTFTDCNNLEWIEWTGEHEEALKRVILSIPKQAECAISAPFVPLKSFSAYMKRMLLFGFAVAYENGDVNNGWDRSAYIQYIRAQRKRLFALALSERALFRLMLAEKMLQVEDVEILLRNQACDTEARALLLSYRNEYFPPERVMRQAYLRKMRMLSRKVSGKKTVKEWKEIWSFFRAINGTISLDRYKGSDEFICVPERIGRSIVSKLGKHVFCGGEEAYRRGNENVSVRRIELPSSVQEISESAFNECPHLDQITVSPDNPVYQVRDGGLYCGQTLVRVPCAQGGCFVIQDGVTEIGAYAFYGCNKLTQIIVPETVTKVGACAITDCTQLQSIRFPKECDFGEWNFSGCVSLKDLMIDGMKCYCEAYFDTIDEE